MIKTVTNSFRFDGDSLSENGDMKHFEFFVMYAAFDVRWPISPKLLINAFLFQKVLTEIKKINFNYYSVFIVEKSKLT